MRFEEELGVFWTERPFRSGGKGRFAGFVDGSCVERWACVDIDCSFGSRLVHVRIYDWVRHVGRKY